MPNAASSTSCTPVWKAPGAVPSRAAVSSGGRVRTSRPVPVTVPVVGSSAGVPVSSLCQAGSSASRCGAEASAASSSDQRRTEVPTGASSTGRSASTASPAARRSGSRIRQETPSTTRWCRTSSSRPGVCSPASSQTAFSITPAAGSRRRRAAAASAAVSARSFSGSAPAASVRTRWSATRTEPTGPVSSSQRPSGAPASRERSTAWWSTSAWSAAVSRGRSSTPDGGRAITASWLNSPIGASSSRSHSVIGVGPTVPVPSSSGPAVPSAGTATAASAATD